MSLSIIFKTSMAHISYDKTKIRSS